MDLMPKGEVMHYVRNYPNASRVHLVSSLILTGKEPIVQYGTLIPGVRLSRRTGLPPFPWSGPWRLEPGWYFIWRSFVQLDIH